MKRSREESQLTSGDYEMLTRSAITPEIAGQAGLYRVCSPAGRDLVGRNGGGDFGGIVFPYRMPGSRDCVLERLRLDHPPIDAVSGKPTHKYLSPPGARNRLYFPPCDPALLTDISMPIVFTEGEKKALALWRAAIESGNGTGTPAFLPVGLAGVWSWRGTVGSRPVADGPGHVPEKGPIPDLDRIECQKRKATILFDTNTATNEKVRAARREFARELAHRGADVSLADLPHAPGVNGVDDYLGRFGLGPLVDILTQAVPYEWRKELITSDKGKILPILANTVTALRSAPEWHGLLAYDEFAFAATATRPTPWQHEGTWDDQQDRLLADWLQHQGICVDDRIASKAVETVARDQVRHPVRKYLDALRWDGKGRLDDWLSAYLGAARSELTRAFGARWMISAVARICRPGVKADHCLILEGEQGLGKSTAFRTLGEPWFTDDIADLGTKDAAMATISAWIIELSELDSMSRTDLSKVKSFMTRNVDRFRPPYGRRVIESQRQCVFCGTVNHSEYLRDDTGGRRFWPVTCGRIDLDSLRQDRDQLWAEAVARYWKGEHWWLETPELEQQAEAEQDARYQADPWEAPIATFLETRSEVTTADVLGDALKIPAGQSTHAESIRVGRILHQFGWKPHRPRGIKTRLRVYRPG